MSSRPFAKWPSLFLLSTLSVFIVLGFARAESNMQYADTSPGALSTDLPDSDRGTFWSASTSDDQRAYDPVENGWQQNYGSSGSSSQNIDGGQSSNNTGSQNQTVEFVGTYGSSSNAYGSDTAATNSEPVYSGQYNFGSGGGNGLGIFFDTQASNTRQGFGGEWTSTTTENQRNTLTVLPNSAALRVLASTSASTSTQPDTDGRWNTSSNTPVSLAQKGVQVVEELRLRDSAKELEKIGRSVQRINSERDSAVDAARTIVRKNVVGVDTNSETAQRRIKETEANIVGLVTNATGPDASPIRRNPGLAIRRSLSELSDALAKDSGTPVKIDEGSRAIAESVFRANENVAREVTALEQRDGLSIYRDSDNDGVSDFDETHIYDTNPNEPFTSGSSLTDGERVLLGLNPLSTSTTPIPAESPKDSGIETTNIFEVTSIAYTPASLDKTIETPAVASTTDEVPATSTLAVIPEKPERAITFSGRALPNSFVTLYIFSTPIVVTVKTDSDGSWSYTLNKELPDGSHEMYVASVNNAGRILAKSAPIPFVKRAEALEFTPLTLPPIRTPTFWDTVRDNFIAAGVLVVLIFLLISLSSIGFWKEAHRKPDAVA